MYSTAPAFSRSFYCMLLIDVTCCCHCHGHRRRPRTKTDVPSHLHYIMLELIKNSMRATVDFHGLDEMDNNPIRVVIADGEENEVRLFCGCVYAVL